MSPTQSKTEREKLIEALREQIAKAESKGLFDTAHHDMLKQLTGEGKKAEKPVEKGVANNG